MSIIFKPTKKNLSAQSGVALVKQLVQAMDLRGLVHDALPRQATTGKIRSFKKLRDLILGLVAGADCVDDMHILAKDQGFLGICDEKVYTPKYYCGFCRSFSRENILDLQESLMRFAFETRLKLFPDDKLFYFDIDSTSNRQYGEKMEGVEYNYKKYKSLDSLNVFDHLGLQYFINVRPGATNTARGCENVIHRLMTTFKEYQGISGKKWRACFRADRGYYNVGFLNACIIKGADVVVGVRQDEHNFPKIIGQIHNWRPTDPDNPGRLRFYDGREVEIGTTRFRPKGCARRLRYVVMRAKSLPDPMFPDYFTYHYYAWATTYSELQMDDDDVIYCYRERGQAENYIKENKYGLDLKHYPFKLLDANRVYALIGAFAYNLMRMMSLAHDPDKPILSKRIRFKWIHIPSLVARTGGNVILRCMEHHYKEMTRWFELIHNLQHGMA